ncbi:DUS2 [Symbiodinium natans]|uniref:DUS2 protein n=1 Tax=Symbiodinium natans TaxID=878477 RepID=A0A812NMV1_9DINO|nr:DUS2 [Symbiodinium natans]
MQVWEWSGAEATTVHLRQRQEPRRSRRTGTSCPDYPSPGQRRFFNRRQIAEFWKHCAATDANGAAQAGGRPTGPAGIMIARGVWNRTIFCRQGAKAIGGVEAPGFEEMIRSYVRTAVATNASYQNTKWVLGLGQMMVAGTGVLVPTTFQGQQPEDHQP